MTSPDPASSARITRADIVAAAARIRNDVRHTPLWRLPGKTLGVAVAEVWLKLEHLQISGSFKARGMFNRLRSAQLPAAGVVIASGGNAGIAAAHAARSLAVRCEVFVPELSSPAKRAALAALGAQVKVQGSAYADALAACLLRQRETGALLMHAYDQVEVVTGAGTLAAEVDAELGVPDRVLVSVGGGGLVAGLASWWGAADAPRPCVVDALEPELAPTLYAARQAGAPVDVAVSGVAADALGARRIGQIAWATNSAIQHSHLLSDDTIRAAQRRLWLDFRLAVEPAAALPIAALWSGVVQPEAHERVLVVICGGNVDLAALAA